MPNTSILYLEAVKRDFIDKFLLNQPGWNLRQADGKIAAKQRMHPDPPWIYVKHTLAQNCNFWHKVLFDVIFGQSKVPIDCQSCFKIVLEPRNLSELLATYLMQKKLNFPSKCGIEVDRENTEKRYGAYWYTKSPEDGQHRYNQVKAELARGLTYDGYILDVPIVEKFEDDILDRLILKRACTEYEQHCGPSDQWTWDEEQEEMELFAKDTFAQDVYVFTQPEHMIAHVITKWIHAACRMKDPTYKKYTNGNKLFAELLTYHDKPLPVFRGKTVNRPIPTEESDNGEKRT